MLFRGPRHAHAREASLLAMRERSPAGEAGEDKLQMLFPTVLQVSDIPQRERIKGPLLEAVRALRAREPSSKPDSWACELYTTIGNPGALLRQPGLAPFRVICEEKLQAFARAMGYDLRNQPPVLRECWVNCYGPGHSQEIHLHRNSVISGIYYLQAPPGSGATLFYSPLADVMLEPRAVESNSLNAKVAGYSPVEGRMLLFRSSLRHSVLPGTFDGERVTIAFNAGV